MAETSRVAPTPKSSSKLPMIILSIILLALVAFFLLIFFKPGLIKLGGKDSGIRIQESGLEFPLPETFMQTKPVEES